jgi:hypothetical protein
MNNQPSSDSGAFFVLCWVICIVATVVITVMS